MNFQRGWMRVWIAVLILGLPAGAFFVAQHQKLRHQVSVPSTPKGEGLQIETNTSVIAASPALAQALRFQAAFDKSGNLPQDAIFREFAGWTAKYLSATTSVQKVALESDGEALGRARRIALASLIQDHPERALQMAVPAEVRRELPASVTSLLEERLNGRGSLSVLAALPEPGRENQVKPLFRVASIDGKDYQAFVYGWRLGQPTRRNIPLQGIAINELAALHESPVRVLGNGEAEAYKPQAKDALCGVSGQSAVVNNTPVVVDLGGEIRYLCGTNHIQGYTDQQIAAEGDTPTGGAGASEAEASVWTEGLKKVILIRVDFPDLNGVSLTESGGATLVSNLHNFYNEMSYGRAGFVTIGSGSDVTPIFRMTNSASWYGTNDYYNQLRSEARAAATAAGYVLGNYDRDVICMGSVPGFGWAGLAYVGSAGAWLRSSFGTGVAGHELGHNWGLNHANYWDTTGQSVIGPGTSVEYGDSFDTMGSASAGNNHFNARYKNYLNWLQTNEVLTVTSNGTYRIYAHDNVNSSGLRGLRVVKNSLTNYWVEFRQKFTGNKWLMNGAGLRWAQNGNQRSHLLDTTPGSADGKNDAALVIGRTFSDPSPGLHITPIGKGSTSPESLDVVVNLGTFPGNIPPEITLAASGTNAATSVTLNFSVVATDANGDALAYYWDFGDGNFGTNGPAASKSWSTAGEYVVRCVVTDMKGGEATESVIVRIGSPTTYRISGQVTDNGTPVEGARVYVSTVRMTYTDTDGSYDLVGLPAGTYTVNATLYPLSLVPSGFANPVSVGANVAGIDFISSTILPPTITTQPLSQTANPGTNVTFTVAATGTAPLRYFWRFNGVNISGATNTSYTRANVQLADAGSYSVLVSNAAGSIASANAVLTLNTPPSITAQPQSQNVIAGTNMTFSVTASGSAPMSYQWRFNGSNIAGATMSTYSVADVQPANAGGYRVVVANSLGAVTSAVATLTVNYSLSIAAPPGGMVTKSPDQPSYAPNSIVTLTASSLSAYTFDSWSGDAVGTNNPLQIVMTANKSITATFSSPVADLIIDNPAATFTGTWGTDNAAADKYGIDYRSTGSAAQTPSATATFTPNIVTGGRYDVYVWFPTFTKPSANVPVIVSSSGGNQAFTLNQMTGAGAWRLLATGITFAPGTNGFVRIANNVGGGGKTVVADAVRLVYSPIQEAVPPTILVQPQSQTTTQGANVAFNVEATGTEPLGYQWRFNTVNISNATDATLNLTNVQPSGAGNYTVVLTNAVGAVTSSVATLTVLGAPTILSQPQSLAVGIGSNAAFHVLANGAPPLAYRWRKNDIDLTDEGTVSGADSPNLMILAALPADAAVYTIEISNSFGSVTSTPALLTVGFEADIASNPNGNNSVDLADWERLGRLVVGLDTLAGDGEFLRADSAPRSSLGDGVVSVIDWVQAGRYAALLDPLTPAGGPASPSLAQRQVAVGVSQTEAPARAVRIVASTLVRERNNDVTVELLALGDENAFGLTLSFDSASMTYISARAVSSETALQINASQAAAGQLGVILGLPPGQTFTAGTNPLLRVTFMPTSVSSSNALVSFSDTLVTRELSDGMATVLPADYLDANLPIMPPAPIIFVSSVRLTNGLMQLTLSGNQGEVYAMETSTNLNSWTLIATLTNNAGIVTYLDSSATNSAARFYRARREP